MPKRAVVTLGDQVRDARVKKKLSQLELARLAGVRPEVVSRIETGKSPGSLESLYKIVPHIDLTLDALVKPNAAGKAATAREKKKKGN